MNIEDAKQCIKNSCEGLALEIIEKHYDKEIQRLNNIIDELETTLEREIDYGNELAIESPNDKEIKIVKNTLILVCQRIKELKEGK